MCLEVKYSDVPRITEEDIIVYKHLKRKLYDDTTDIDLFDEKITTLGYRHWYHIFIGKKTRRFVSGLCFRRKESKHYQLICTNWSLKNAEGHNVI